jgi:hypothetical protein
MGFSSSKLEGAVQNAVPTISYAYATTNTQAFGLPGYYFKNGKSPKGQEHVYH